MAENRRSARQVHANIGARDAPEGRKKLQAGRGAVHDAAIADPGRCRTVALQLGQPRYAGCGVPKLPVGNARLLTGLLSGITDATCLPGRRRTGFMMTLYDAFVPGCLQILRSVSGLLTKAEAHCAEQSIAPETLIGAKLAPDMLDFAYQVKSCAVHSIGAIAGVRNGRFSPDRTPPPGSFAGLRTEIAEAINGLEALSPEEVEALSAAPMAFTIGEKLRWEFTGKDFLTSFSQPNFYFHATTAYAILRMKGVAIGKADYLGAVRKQG
jgi:hypothetical protein